MVCVRVCVCAVIVTWKGMLLTLFHPIEFIDVKFIQNFNLKYSYKNLKNKINRRTSQRQLD